MGKTKIRDKELSKGESLTVKVDEVSDGWVTGFLSEDDEDKGNKIRFPVTDKVAELIEDDYEDEIITLTRDDKTYDIEDHEDWPEQKSKEKDGK